MNSLFLAVVLLAAPAGASAPWLESYAEGLAAARSSGRNVLVDFSAAWCYSCYFMDQHVLGGDGFAKAARDLALVRLDVDRPEGRELKERLRIHGLPSYVVLDAQGGELGRISGEQTESDFLAELGAITAKTGGPEDEALRKLEGFLQTAELEEAEAFRKGLPKDLAAGLEKRPRWRVLSARLALKRKPSEDKLVFLAEHEESCEFAYDVFDGLGAKPGAGAFKAVRARLEALVESRVFGARPARCADLRSAVEALADVYEAQADAAARAGLLERTISLLRKDSQGGGGLGADRNLDDNLRFFLELAGRDQELEAVYPKLVDAYPADYVYAYRFAKWLAGKKRFAEALPWIEKADRLSYGANRLTVTKTRAGILTGLGRKEEGERLLERDIKAGAKK